MYVPLFLYLPFHNIPHNGHTNSILFQGGEIWDGVDSSSWPFRFLCFYLSCHLRKMQHPHEDGMLIPMGHSIGIKMDLSGVFITNDVMISKDNWLKAGDLIEQLDDVTISTLKDFETALSAMQGKNEIALTCHPGRGYKPDPSRWRSDETSPSIPERSDGRDRNLNVCRSGQRNIWCARSSNH